MALRVARGRRFSIVIKGASSHQLTSWPGCRARRSRSAGQDESAAMSTSWTRGCVESLNTRRCIYRLTAMAGMPKSTWPASCGGTIVYGLKAPW